MKQYAILLSIDKPRLKEDGIEKRELYDSINDAMEKIGFHLSDSEGVYIHKASYEGSSLKCDPVKIILDGQKMLHEENWAVEYCSSIQLVLIDNLGDLKQLASRHK